MSSIIDKSGNEIMEWPSDGLEYMEHCPICGHAERTVLHDALTDKVFFCAPGKWTMYRCEHCASGYLNPRPTIDTIGKAYESYYTHAGDIGTSLRGLRRFRRILANGYRNKKYGTHEQPSNSLGYWLIKLIFPQRAFLDSTMRHLPRAPDNGLLLDIGCGNGEFLARAQDAGWVVYGVDPDPKAVATSRSKGLNVMQGEVDKVENLRGLLDGITLRHSIEHVHDPVSLLTACFNLLKPGGWIWVETPNIMSEGYKKYAENWVHVDSPRHLCLFNPDSLRTALHGSGFSNIDDMPWRPIYLDASLESENIKEGIPPYTKRKADPHIWITTVLAEYRSIAKPGLREFITLRAYKPL